MNIVVTGGSGHIGRYVVRDLVQAGHQVTSVDVVFATFSDACSHQVDLTDAGQVYQALVGARAEAVVHLGAWSFDGRVPPTRTFGDNVCGTFNVFQACADLGIERVVSASTNHVYGVVKTPPDYFPIDEAHPLRPAGPYALSKVVAEQMADYFTSQHDLEILSFRFMGIRSPARLDSDIERIVQNPERGIHLLWTRTDARDAALACRLAVETEDIESGPYNITGRNIVLDQDSAELVKRHFGNQVEMREGLIGRASPLSCARAEKAFEYRPQYDWSVRQRFPEETNSGIRSVYVEIEQA